MKITIYNKNNCVGNFRLDANTYLEEHLNFEKKLKSIPHTILDNEIQLFAKGIFDIKADCYTETGIPFVRINNLKRMIIEEGNIVFIPKEENEKNIKTCLKRNDIILSKTAIPAASLVTLEICNTCQDTIALKLKEDSIIKSHYLTVFLNSKYGMSQMRRWFSGNIQMHLNISESREIIIPIFSREFQDMIKEKFELAIGKKEYTKELFIEVNEILMKEIDIEDYWNNNITIYSKKLSDIFENQRIDAGYFQPKYYDLIKSIQKYDYEKAENLITIQNKRFSPDNNQLYNYIELSDINPYTGEIINSIEDYGKNLPTRARRLVQTNDVLVSSIEGSITNCALVTEDFNNFICSTGFLVVRSTHFSPEILLLLIKSPIGQIQLIRGCSGSILTAINKIEFRKMILPKLSNEIDQKISEKIKEIYIINKHVNQIFDKLIKYVEIAIESDEEDAITLLAEIKD